MLKLFNKKDESHQENYSSLQEQGKKEVAYLFCLFS